MAHDAKDAITLREVADAAGVHPGTASRALNESTRSLVRPETVARVMAAAEALGYRPNYLARSFKTRQTRSVGVVIPDINNPLFPPMVLGIEDRLTSEGYVTVLANTQNDAGRRVRIFDEMVERHVDGLIVATATRDDPELVALHQRGVAVVLVNRVVEGRAFPSASVDDAAGIRSVVEYLTGIGHVRIAHVAGPQSMSTGFARYQAFAASMRAAGIPVDPGLVAEATGFTIDEGERCAAAFLQGPAVPTAIVAANDMLALGCYSALGRAGLRCPDDVSVVGFNDMPFVDRMDPPLTTVRIPHHELGVHAAQLLVDRLRNPEAPVTGRLLIPSLVVRRSTAPVTSSVQVG